jgi:hypothetical protein
MKLYQSYYNPKKDLPADTHFYWRVLLTPVSGKALYSEVRQFDTGNPPAAPTLKLPKKNGLVTNLRPLFDWKDSKVPKDTTFDRYEIQVTDDWTFSTTVIDELTLIPLDVTNSTYTPTIDLNPATLYYWRVRGWNTHGDFGPWSKVLTFREAYPAPTNLMVDKTNPARPFFSWAAIPIVPVTSYKILVTTDPLFKSKVIYVTVFDTNYTPTKDLLPGTYYWRVQALGTFGPGLWGTSTFTTP